MDVITNPQQIQHSETTQQQQTQPLQSTKALPVHVNMQRPSGTTTSTTSSSTSTTHHTRSNSSLSQHGVPNPVILAGPIAHLKAQQRPFSHARTMSGTQPLPGRPLLPTAACSPSSTVVGKLGPMVLSPGGSPSDCFRLQMSGGNRLTSHRRTCSAAGGEGDFPADGALFIGQDGAAAFAQLGAAGGPGGPPSDPLSPVPARGDISEFVNYALATPCAPSPMSGMRNAAGPYSPYMYDRSPSPSIVAQSPLVGAAGQPIPQGLGLMPQAEREEDQEKRRRTYTFFKEKIESGRLVVQLDPPELTDMSNDSQKREQLGSVVGKAYGFLFDKKRFKLGSKTESVFDFSRSPTGLLSYIPPSNIHRFVERIAKYVPLSAEALILSLIYIDFLLERGILDVNSKNAQRVFATAFVTASKFAYDRVYSNKFYAKVTYLEVTELDDLEIEFLKLFKFNVTPSLDDWNSYASWIYAVAFPTTRRSPSGAHPYSPPLTGSMLSAGVVASAPGSPGGYYHHPASPQQVMIAGGAGQPTPLQLHPTAGAAVAVGGVGGAGGAGGVGGSQLVVQGSYLGPGKNGQSLGAASTPSYSGGDGNGNGSGNGHNGGLSVNVNLNGNGKKESKSAGNVAKNGKHGDGRKDTGDSSESGSSSGSSSESRSASESGSGSASESGSCSGSSTGSGSGSGSCSGSSSGSSSGSVSYSGSSTGSQTSTGGSSSGSSTGTGSRSGSSTGSGSGSGTGSVISRSSSTVSSSSSSMLSNECVGWGGKNPISVGESEGDLDESPEIRKGSSAGDLKCRNTVDTTGAAGNKRNKEGDDKDNNNNNKNNKNNGNYEEEADDDDDDEYESESESEEEDSDDYEIIVHDTENEEEEGDESESESEDEENDEQGSEKSIGGFSNVKK